jgi:hypothetical protein
MTSAETAAQTSTRVVDAFLEAVRSGAGIPADLYGPEAMLDATVPSWRFEKQGPADIVVEYARWFADLGRFEELDRQPTPNGEVVSYTLTWEEDGEPHAAHHCHVLILDEHGRIIRDTVWCGGRWGAQLLADMGAAAHA